MSFKQLRAHFSIVKLKPIFKQHVKMILTGIFVPFTMASNSYGQKISCTMDKNIKDFNLGQKFFSRNPDKDIWDFTMG